MKLLRYGAGPEWTVLMLYAAAAALLWFTPFEFQALDLGLLLFSLNAVMMLSAALMNSRLLAGAVLTGGFVSAAELYAVGGGGLPLFLCLSAWNPACFLLGIRFSWPAVKRMALGGTWLLFLLYYLGEDAAHSQGWQEPLQAASGIFVFFAAALFFSSWKEGRCFGGLHLSLGIWNGAVFGFWLLVFSSGSRFLLNAMSLLGLFYVLLAAAVYALVRRMDTAVMTKLFGGGMLLVLALAQLLKSQELTPLLQTFIGLGLCALLLALGAFYRQDALRGLAMVLWSGVFIRWITGSAEAAPGSWSWLPSRMPLMHPEVWCGALLAVLAFILSSRVQIRRLKPEDNRMLSSVFRVLAHASIVLLTADEVYRLSRSGALAEMISLPAGWILSMLWGIHALALYLYGTWSSRMLLKALGSSGLICILVKAWLLDLRGYPLAAKLAALLLLAAISSISAYWNHRQSGLPPVPTDSSS